MSTTISYVPIDPYVRPDRPVIIITGPTACGKSETALLLAEALNGEIVSADSMQVYLGMDIGTAKTPLNERRGIPHHLIDICDPGSRFSVADYQTLAHQAIRLIYDRGNWPIICGGTGQYISALTEGLVFPPIAADLRLRDQFNSEADQDGLESLHHRLALADPEAAARISPNDRKRIIRALEMMAQSGRPQQEHIEQSRRFGPAFVFKSICLSFDRPLLYEKINQRVLDMIESGLENEVRTLLGKGLSVENTCLQAIGYKEMIPYMQGQTTLRETISIIQQATRRYAKRQLTWFRHMDGLIWLTNHNPPVNSEIIKNSLQNIR